MAIKLYDYQKEAIRNMKNGCVLCGDVGSGKSITAIAYYFGLQSGKLEPKYKLMVNPKDLYIITTARKRDQLEWDHDLAPFLLSQNNDISQYDNKVVIDSWNNIKKYVDVENSFFIFDEQRVVGYGAWTKSFLKITKRNEWILLSATPGDTWMDYIPVFIANGFYKNKTEFIKEHVIWNSYSKYPKVDKYIGTKRLIRERDYILVNMDYKKPTESVHIDILVDYDRHLYRTVMKKWWDVYKDEPIKNAGELCYVLRHVVNSDKSRSEAVLRITKEKKRTIIFYNFDYELDILRSLDYGEDTIVLEWNGHKHQTIPDKGNWVYLVQYNAGSEGWNCIQTDTIIFYSQNYSYRTMVQASGRIDRLNTPYYSLYYYHLKSNSSIDLAIGRALKHKKQFNASRFIKSRV